MELLTAETLATVSHELRSPLASIKGYTATLLRHDHRISPRERRAFLMTVLDASSRLANVIDALLEIAELEIGTTPIERTSINIVPLIQEVTGYVTQQMNQWSDDSQASLRQHTHLTFQLDTCQGGASSDVFLVEADESRLRKVLDHLLQNVIMHATDCESITVSVCPIYSENDIRSMSFSSQESIRHLTTFQQRHQHVVVIAVQDDGKGIAAEHLAHIFEPFYRVDTQLTRESNGLGLGLTICRRIIELYDGILWAESEPGQGSMFYVCLPLEKIQEANYEEHMKVPIETTEVDEAT